MAPARRNIPELARPRPQIWWSNATFFCLVHVLAVAGVFIRPLRVVPYKTLLLALVSWQLGEFGITIGYHRLYSHRAFRATPGVRVVLALLGSSAFQGSIKWWCLRHRLHHRFTDDLEHDPYAATRGLFYSHMGWIFFKPNYQKMSFIDRDDLEADPVVRFQHKYYVPLALFFGFMLPPLVGLLWHDAFGAFIWAGLVSRVAIWHCTFLVNSLAHWDGLQPYSDEDTSRGNLLLAVLTSGEGNHNFHAFPHDYRSGPSPFDWDPSKWLILGLRYLGLAKGLRKARDDDMAEAIDYMHQKAHPGAIESEDLDDWHGDTWDRQQLAEYLSMKPGSCILLIDGYAVNATFYLAEHPGGASILRRYSLSVGNDDKVEASEASWAFNGGLNNHSRSAKRRLRGLRVARVSFDRKDMK
ncbi:hypothetical protein HGRIS_008272 [Hohenbuehelia grisea]|uniref:Acyl-CoA desaturase n=1 Tax=Hohenbuehelia grisea TaxID=104357 RepID=A0ABR3J7V1_9AGAR